MRDCAEALDDLVAGIAGRTEPALVLLTGPRGSGKSRWCERLAGAGRAAGLNVTGFVSPAVFESGAKTAIDLLDVSTGARRRRRRGEGRMTTIHDIDFGLLYRDHLAAAGRQERPPEAWDARAAQMSRETDGSGYVDEFVRRMDLSGCTTLLDVGCGPGAIALAVAGRLARVYGLDFSRGMLDALMENAAVRGLNNVEPIQRAWDEDWADVPACDLVVASRSTLVNDLADALARLDAKANRRVCLTSLVGGRFVHAGILQALGRENAPLPDYIYVLNILYQMGRQPRLDYIRSERRQAAAPDLDTLVRRVAFSLGELNEAEKERLAAWFRSDPDGARLADSPRCWAFISWETRAS